MDDDATAIKTPQDKKALSYAKDRRACYGESNKGPRKIIPRRKASENRSNRHKVAQSLSDIPRLDEAAAAVVESSARHDVNRAGGWRKSPDIPLAQHVERQDQRRLLREAGRAERRQHRLQSKPQAPAHQAD